MPQALHDSDTLVRYALGDLSKHRQFAVEEHISACSRCRDFVTFLQSFNAGLRHAAPARDRPKEPCPDPLLLISLRDNELDDETAQHVRVHMLYCDTCCDAFERLDSAQPQFFDIFLRKAGAVIESLRGPLKEFANLAPVAVRSRDGELTFSAPFRSSQSITDPDTGLEHTFTLLVEDALKLDERVRFSFACSPKPDQWRATLRDSSGNELASAYLEKATDIAAALALGSYGIEILKDDELLARFSLSIEPFQLEEALDAAIANLESRHYSRALAILDYATRRDPESREAWAVRCLALALATKDRESADGRVLRHHDDFGKEVDEIITEAQKRFRDEIGSALAAVLTDHPASLPLQVLEQLAHKSVSMTILPVMRLVTKRTQSVDDTLTTIFVETVSRLEHVEIRMEELRDSINAVRRDLKRDVDEKFATVGTLLDEKIKEIEEKYATFRDQKPLVRGADSELCWDWLGADIQRMLTTAEGVFHYQRRLPVEDNPDFSPGLLQYCRGLELLLNEKLGTWYAAIYRDAMTFTLPPRDRELLRRMDHRILKLQKTLGIGQVADLLYIAREVRDTAAGNAFSREVEQFLSARPVLSSAGFLELLMLLGRLFRNGKTHPMPGSLSMFTSIHEMRLVRKVVIGLDDSQVPAGRVLGWIAESPRLSPDQRKQTSSELRSAWSAYPGVVKILWQTMESPGA